MYFGVKSYTHYTCMYSLRIEMYRAIVSRMITISRADYCNNRTLYISDNYCTQII